MARAEKAIASTWADEDGSVTGYMCLIDWEYEIGGASDGNRVYPSVETLKEHHQCADECGIVEVRVSFSRLIAPGKEPA